MGAAGPSYLDRALDVIRILQEFLSKKGDFCGVFLELFKMSDFSSPFFKIRIYFNISQQNLIIQPEKVTIFQQMPMEFCNNCNRNSSRKCNWLSPLFDFLHFYFQIVPEFYLQLGGFMWWFWHRRTRVVWQLSCHLQVNNFQKVSFFNHFWQILFTW